jgi:hypothetical protein
MLDAMSTRMQEIIRGWSGILDVGGQFVADIGECKIDISGQCAHAGDRGESDQRDDERVFDEVLTLFVLENIREHLSFGVNLQNRIFHGGVFSGLFFMFALFQQVRFYKGNLRTNPKPLCFIASS